MTRTHEAYEKTVQLSSKYKENFVEVAHLLRRRPKTTESRGVIWRGTSAAGIPFRVGRH